MAHRLRDPRVYDPGLQWGERAEAELPRGTPAGQGPAAPGSSGDGGHLGPRQMKEPQGFLPAEDRSAGRDQSISARCPALPPGLVVKKRQGRETCDQKEGSGHTRVHTHARAYTHIHTNAHMCSDTCIHVHACAYTRIHTDAHIHSDTCIHMHARTYTHIHTNAHMRSDTCMQAHIHAYIHTNARMCSDTCIYTHVHGHTYTGKHRYFLISSS